MVFGDGSDRFIMLTHQSQLRRFVSHLRHILRCCPHWEISTTKLEESFREFLGKPFIISNYGVCYLDDLISDLPGNTILVENKDGIQIIRLAGAEVLSHLEDRVVVMLAGLEQGLALPAFLTTFHQHHGHSLHLHDYSVSSVRELLHLIPTAVVVERKSGRDIIRLLEGYEDRLLLHRAVHVFSSSPGLTMSTTDFCLRYIDMFSHYLEPSKLEAKVKDINLANSKADECGADQMKLKVEGHMISMMGGETMGLDGRQLTRCLSFGQSMDVPAIDSILKPRTSLPGVAAASSDATSEDSCNNNEAQVSDLSSRKLEVDSQVKRCPKLEKSCNLHMSGSPSNTIKPEPNKNKIHIPSWIPSSMCEVTQTHTSTREHVSPEKQPSEGAEEEGTDTPRDDTTLVAYSECSPSSSHFQHSASPRALTSDEDTSVPNSTSRSESCSLGNRLVHSRPCSRTGSNSSGSPMGSPLQYPGTPRRNRMAARFTYPFLPPSPSVQSDSDV